jgi:hypothetical protein
MKKLAVLALIIMSGNVLAGIPKTVCSTPNAGIQLISEMPGIDFLIVRLDSEGTTEKLSVMDVNIEESNIHVIREKSGSGGSYRKTYSATLSISKADGSLMPDAYTTVRKDDGSLEVDAICEFSVF